MKVENIEVLEKFLNEVLKENVTHDLKMWLEDVYSSICNGNYDLEVSKQYTKSGLPELIRFSYTYELDENNDEYINVVF